MHTVCNDDGFFNDLPLLEKKGLNKRASVNFTGDSALERKLEELMYREQQIADKIQKVKEEIKNPKKVEVKMT